MSSTDLALTVLRQTNNQTAMDAARSLQAIEKLRGSLSLMNNRYDSRLNQARLQNQTWGQYVTAEDSRIKRNVGEAKLQVIEDQRILSMVNRDYDFANAQAAKIPQTQGMHESLNQLNTQMNRVVVQNAEMIRLMARAQGNGSSEDRVQQAEKDAQKIRDADAEKAATEAQALRRKAAIDALGNYK
jgi:uncharacterized protein YneF (UPF0154 family)